MSKKSVNGSSRNERLARSWRRRRQRYVSNSSLLFLTLTLSLIFSVRLRKRRRLRRLLRKKRCVSTPNPSSTLILIYYLLTYVLWQAEELETKKVCLFFAYIIFETYTLLTLCSKINQKEEELKEVCPSLFLSLFCVLTNEIPFRN